MNRDLDRRALLGGAAALGTGAVLSACGGASATGASPAATTSTAASPSAGATADSIGNIASAAPAAAGSLGAASAVPVGGGVVFEKQKVVVTQPTAGAFKAFSAVCPHQGCILSQVKDSKILCNCHGSQFSIADGSVLGGPAPSPLKPAAISAAGGQLKLG